MAKPWITRIPQKNLLACKRIGQPQPAKTNQDSSEFLGTDGGQNWHLQHGNKGKLSVVKLCIFFKNMTQFYKYLIINDQKIYKY